MTSEHIALQRVSNTRDLGGMAGLGGRRIQSSKLYRSGELHGASDADRIWLCNHIDLVIDLRTPQEIAEAPDPELPGIRFVTLPIMESLTQGVTYEKDAYDQVFLRLASNPAEAFNYMIQVYENMICQEHARKLWSRMLDLLTEKYDRGILFHCTAGKDRAGMAAILIEEILGVESSDILEDYLYTGICLQKHINDLIEGIKQSFGNRTQPVSDEALRHLFDVHPTYFSALFRAAEDRFGGMQGWIRDGLCVTQDMMKSLQRLYLSP